MSQTNDKERIFYGHNEAINVLCALGGRSFQRPRVPNDWKIRILEKGLGIQYFNSNDPHEFANVMPPRSEYENRIYHDFYVIYHYPSSLVSKQFKEKIIFDRKNPDHIEILNNLNVNFPAAHERRDKADEAGARLVNFWFSPEDLQFVRRFLNFNPIPQAILDHIGKLMCSCHRLALSRTEGGVLHQHKESQYFHTRIANHITNPRPFVKVATERGYHTITGKRSTFDASDTHIPIEIVLGNPLDWNVTPCRKVYSLRNFDYDTARKHVENRTIQEQKRGHLYV